jgi:hypothetical protein
VAALVPCGRYGAKLAAETVEVTFQVPGRFAFCVDVPVDGVASKTTDSVTLPPPETTPSVRNADENATEEVDGKGPISRIR